MDFTISSAVQDAKITCLYFTSVQLSEEMELPSYRSTVEVSLKYKFTIFTHDEKIMVFPLCPRKLSPQISQFASSNHTEFSLTILPQVNGVISLLSSSSTNRDKDTNQKITCNIVFGRLKDNNSYSFVLNTKTNLCPHIWGDKKASN